MRLATRVFVVGRARPRSLPLSLLQEGAQRARQAATGDASTLQVGGAVRRQPSPGAAEDACGAGTGGRG